jgi:hypothetical protein
MVNNVHPETFKAHTPYRNWLTLDAAMRFLEAKHGWTHTAGPTRWDEQSKQAVRASRSERNALRTARQQPTGAAAKFEHYHDEESLQTYPICFHRESSSEDSVTSNHRRCIVRAKLQKAARDSKMCIGDVSA